jgi:acyl-coenzyme A synthetase/AMP-(fatty) acid ligase
MSDASWRLSADGLRKHGKAIAVEGVGEALSYDKLASRATAIADALELVGIRAGDPVALISKGRGHDECVGAAGIVCAGATVVPLDATSPPLRLAKIMRARGCRAVVHDESAAKLVAADDAPARIELDPDGFILSSIGDAPPPLGEPEPELACILHTSGSTGDPKAIPITWAHLDTFTTWMIDLTGLKTGDRVLRVAELIFDLAWFDHLGSWRAGATLCTMSRRHITAGKSLLAQLETLRPTVMYAVPALWTKAIGALAAGTQLDPSLRIICFAGEVFPPRDLKALAERAPSARLFNLFGPTETNVCTFHEVRRDELDGSSELPIGIACPYADCRLVDDDAKVIEGAGSGELIVRGPTAMGGEIATRDRVERRDDGLFYFRGRIDRMLKIRGFRVDPGEVEAALLSHDAVREAAVRGGVHPRLGKILHGYVSGRAGATAPESRALRKHLAQRLAPYMVPDAIDVIDALPRTSTGKIDYQAL